MEKCGNKNCTERVRFISIGSVLSPLFIAENVFSVAGIRLAVSITACLLAVIATLFFMHKLRRHRFFVSIRHGKSTSVTANQQSDRMA